MPAPFPSSARMGLCSMAVVTLLAACGGGNSPIPPAPPVPAGPNVVMQWDQMALAAIRKTKPGPPMTARALAMVDTAMYDAWAAYDAKALATQYGAELRRPAHEHLAGYQSKAISYAAFEVLVDLYPSEKASFEAAMRNMGYDPDVRSSDRNLPEGVGHLTAQALLNYRHTDGANQLGDLSPLDANGNRVPYADYTGYQPSNPALVVGQATDVANMPRPDLWQPLTYVNQAGATVTPKYIAPHWGKVRPFAMTRGDQFRPPAPPKFGSPEYLAQVQEVVDITANLSDKEKCISEYWADGPSSELPPGHWHLFAQQVSERDQHTLADDAKMLFALSNAVFDAGIATWDAKRTYETSRPITAIRYLFAGKTIQGWGGAGLNHVSMNGANWIPFQPTWFPTPPFPEYTSGHSAFSAAAAEVLKRYTGSDAWVGQVTIPAHSLKAEPSAPSSDVVLSWRSYSEAADEAGRSRLYGGIHFHDGDIQGRNVGRQAGTQAYLKAQSYWLGVVQP